MSLVPVLLALAGALSAAPSGAAAEPAAPSRAVVAEAPSADAAPAAASEAPSADAAPAAAPASAPATPPAPPPSAPASAPASGRPPGADSAQGPLTVGLLRFENQTGVYHFRRLETLVPAIIAETLAGRRDVVIVETERREEMLKELALGLSDLASDDGRLERVAELLNVRFLVAGRLTRTGTRVRIDARIIEVSTGAVMVERVEGPEGDESEDYSAMVRLLAFNLAQNLTGEGRHVDRALVTNYYPWLVTGATLAAVAGSVVFARQARLAHDRYLAATTLDDIADRHRTARAWHLGFAVGVNLSVVGAIFSSSLLYKHYSDANWLDARRGASEPPPGEEARP